MARANHDSGVARYLREIDKFPLLSSDEEQKLARLWRDRADPVAANRLVTSHLRLVVKIATDFGGYGLPFSELISEGNVGMMQAMKRFDPDRGFRLATYAISWIRASIQEYVMRSRSLVRMGTTSAQKRLFFNLRRLKREIGAIDDGDLSPENVRKIAIALEVPEADVVSMNRRLAAPDDSLNAPGGGEDDWLSMLPDSASGQEAVLIERSEQLRRHRLVCHALTKLNRREHDIVVERRLSENPSSLSELGKRYAVSPERIRQIDSRAFEKMRLAIGAETSGGGSLVTSRTAGHRILRRSSLRNDLAGFGRLHSGGSAGGCLIRKQDPTHSDSLRDVGSEAEHSDPR